MCSRTCAPSDMCHANVLRAGHVWIDYKHGRSRHDTNERLDDIVRLTGIAAVNRTEIALAIARETWYETNFTCRALFVASPWECF